MIPLTQFVTITPDIQNLLIKIEGQKAALNYLPQDPAIVAHMRKMSFLHSAIFSARIEGNKLTPENFATSPNNLEKLEAQNLLDTYSWLKSTNQLDLIFIKQLHARSMKNLRADAGHLRKEQNAIFNQAGVAIYLPPPPEDVEPLLQSMLEIIDKSSSHPLITNIISHYQFEKIHPFVDGNGRVGRLLFTTHLKKSGFNFSDLLGLEKHIENTRSDYYYHLGNESKDLTSFAVYMLTLISQATDQVFNILQKPSSPATSLLLPRRRELLNIIRDHSPCSFDFLHRRFVGIPGSTLRYDLLQLQKARLIQKLGTTRGALYSSTSLPE